jgi:hypothetical protein
MPAPLALAHGLLAAEMGMNLQMALGQKRFLLIHAATVERDGRVLLMTGASGAGKSTLAALLGEHGWRLMGDEFALLDLDDGLLHPFPRAISLKNQAIYVMEEIAGADRLGPWLRNTPKGTIRHLARKRTRSSGWASGSAGDGPVPRLRARPNAVRPVGAAEVSFA